MSDLTSKHGNPGRGYKIESGHHIAMLDVRPSAGGAVGFPYSCLDMVQFIPPTALRLVFADCEVSIDGDHLLTLYEYFVQHSVVFIQVSSADSERGHALPLIKRIDVKPPNSNQERLIGTQTLTKTAQSYGFGSTMREPTMGYPKLAAR